MNNNEIPLHYVCTHEEAKELVEKYSRFWISNCGCREGKGRKCRRSRIDLCLMFREDIKPSGSNMHEVSADELQEIFCEAKEKQLVTRPFRNEQNKSIADGICFCCDDCCEYFARPDEVCDKGAYIEKTEMEMCGNCGTCVEVCYFDARELNDDELRITQDNCYGCGLCVDRCPEECIQMVPVP